MGFMTPDNARKLVGSPSSQELLANHIRHLEEEIKEIDEKKGFFNSWASFLAPKYQNEQRELKQTKLTGLQALQDSKINNVAELDTHVKRQSSGFLSGFFSTTQKIIDGYREELAAKEKILDRKVQLQPMSSPGRKF